MYKYALPIIFVCLVSVRVASYWFSPALGYISYMSTKLLGDPGCLHWAMSIGFVNRIMFFSEISFLFTGQQAHHPRKCNS